MYEENIRILEDLVRSGAVLWPNEVQNKPDGTLNLTANKTLWNRAVARFVSIPLWEEGAPGYDGRDPDQIQPNLIFFPSCDPEPRGTVIISHGGAFLCRAGHEGFHTAKYFSDAGFNTAVLTYRLSPYTRYDAMADLHRAIRLLRSRSDELGITDRIAVLGFSAGGMLSANCATHFDCGDPDAADPIQRRSCRPDAAVLCYGAFATTAFPGKMFSDPFSVPEKERAEKLYLSPENNVTALTPPFFIWQTISDDPRNSFVLGSALTQAGVRFELHCFDEGYHGVGLADGSNDSGFRGEHLMHWAPLCAEWLKKQNI